MLSQYQIQKGRQGQVHPLSNKNQMQINGHNYVLAKWFKDRTDHEQLGSSITADFVGSHEIV